MNLVQVSLLLIGERGQRRHFFRYQPLLPIGWRIVQINANAGNNDQYSANHSVQYKQQATPLVTSRNDKNK